MAHWLFLGLCSTVLLNVIIAYFQQWRYKVINAYKIIIHEAENVYFDFGGGEGGFNGVGYGTVFSELVSETRL